MLRAAAARAAAEGLRLTTLCADAEAFIDGAEDASFDVMSLRFCLAYLDWRAALVRLPRALRPGGRVGILTNLSTSAPQAHAVDCRIADEIGLRKVALPVPDSMDDVVELLHRGGLRTEASFRHGFRLWFGSGPEVAGWLQESGFVTHPALLELAPEALEALVDTFARRLEAYRAPQGIPLDFELGGIVAVAP